jgi:hypothetical protein
MAGKNIDNRVLVGEEGGIQRVLFSMHSSLEEIQDMVQTLQPRIKVTPIAKPDLVTKEKVFLLVSLDHFITVAFSIFFFFKDCSTFRLQSCNAHQSIPFPKQ